MEWLSGCVMESSDCTVLLVSVHAEMFARLSGLFSVFNPRNISRTLNRFSSEKELPRSVQGLVLCDVHLLRSRVKRMALKKRERYQLEQDLREVEGAAEYSLTVNQRLGTIFRIQQSFPFLK